MPKPFLTRPMKIRASCATSVYATATMLPITVYSTVTPADTQTAITRGTLAITLRLVPAKQNFKL